MIDGPAFQYVTVENRGLDAGRYWELRTPVQAWNQLEQGVRYSMTAPGRTAHRLFLGRKRNPI